MYLFGNKAKNNNSNERVLHQNEVQFLEALGIETDGSNLQNATVVAIMRILTEAVSKLPLKLMAKIDDSLAEAEDHSLKYVFETRPNPNMSPTDFWKAMEFQRIFHGNSYAYIERDASGKVLGLHPIESTNVRVLVDDAGVFDSKSQLNYILNLNGVEYRAESSQMLHFKSFTENGLIGKSLLTLIQSELGTLKGGSRFVSNFFKKGLSASGILQYTGDISPEAQRLMRDKFEDLASGVDNSGRILPLPAGFTYQSIKNSMVDAQFVEVNKLTIAQIASVFGVKMSMLNDSVSSKYSSSVAESEAFYRDVLLSTLKQYEEELNFKLLTPMEVKQGYFTMFNVEAMLRANIDDRYESYRKAIQAGMMTPNEARRLERMKALPGGDRLLVNSAMIYMDTGESVMGTEGGETDGTEPTDSEE